jgi:hypothetical protein
VEDWREEAFRNFVAQQAREDAQWQRDNPDKVRFYLEGAPDEPLTFTVQGQESLQSVITALKENRIEADAPVMAVDSADAVGGYTGLIAVFITSLASASSVIAVAWLKARAGRKVRIKDGDIEVEAATVDDVTKLHKQILAARAKREQKARP